MLESEKARSTLIRAQINPRLLIFTVSFACLFVYLGFWQLDRAQVKQQQINLSQQLAKEPITAFEALKPEEWILGRRVAVKGAIDNDQVFLLDNVVLGGQVGFEVLHTLTLADGRTMLINRGFVSGGASRDQLPEVPRLKDEVNALGSIYVSEWANQGQAFAYDGWPRIVPTQDPSRLAKIVSRPLLPVVVRLAEQDINSLPRNWRVTVMTPQQHQGYAVQWFVMAGTLLAFFVYFTFRTGGGAEA